MKLTNRFRPVLVGASVGVFFVGLTGVSIRAAFDQASGPTRSSGGAAGTPFITEGVLDGEVPEIANEPNAASSGAVAAPVSRTTTPRVTTSRSATAADAQRFVAGRGVTADKIAIGIQYNAAINYAAFGGSAEDSGDAKGMAQAIIEALNAEGGISGRQVVPVFHETEVTTGTFAQHNQEACADLAEDHEVFAVLGTTNGIDEPQCLAGHDTIYLTQKRTFQDQSMFDAHPAHYFMPGRMSATRWGAAYVDGLAAQGYFKGATVGILRFDNPGYDRLMAKVVRPRFAAHGVTIRDEVAITDATATAVLGQVAAELSNAVLRFRSDGVDHVMFVEAGGVLPFFFFSEAESQRYRPIYGLQSASLPQFHEPDQPEQLRGSMGVGWMPAEDVNFEHDPGDVPRKEKCAAILARAGYTFSDRIGYSSAVGYCDMLLFTRAALETTSQWTSAGFRAAVDRLGTSYQSAATFSTRFGPGRHDGPAMVRPLAWAEDCACFVYTGPARSHP